MNDKERRIAQLNERERRIHAQRQAEFAAETNAAVARFIANADAYDATSGQWVAPGGSAVDGQPAELSPSNITSPPQQTVGKPEGNLSRPSRLRTSQLRSSPQEQETLAARGRVPAPVVPQKRKSPPATPPPLSPVALQPAEYKSPPQLESAGRLGGLGDGEPHVPHCSHSSQRQSSNNEQSREDSPFRPLVPGYPVEKMAIPAEAMYICAQQVRAMLQPYCQCGNRSSRANGKDLDYMANKLLFRIGELVDDRRESQYKQHGRWNTMDTQVGKDKLIEPEDDKDGGCPFPFQWPRPPHRDYDYRDYQKDGELELKRFLEGKWAGKSMGELSVQRAESLWRAQVPDDNDIKIERHYDIDSIYMELISLKAITKPSNLCLVPCCTPAVSPHCILTDDIKPHRHMNTALLELDRGYVYLVFPGLEVNSNSSASNAITDEQQRDLVDNYVLPALRRVLQSIAMQEWPQSFDAAVARASTPHVKQRTMDDGTDSAAARQKTALLYPIQSEYLEPFWEEFTHRITRPGCPFIGAKLCFQRRNLKNVTDSQDAAEVMTRLRKLFTSFDWNLVPYDRCWVSFGLRDQVSLPERCPRTTLLYRAECLAHLDHGGCDERPWVGFTPRQSMEYLMRDVGSMEEVREGDDAKGAPSSHRFTRHLEAYNSHRTALFPDKPYPPFSQDEFRRLLVHDQLDAQLPAASSHGRSRSNEAGRPTTFESVVESWENQIRTVHEELHGSTFQDFGVRRQITINPHVLLALLEKDSLRNSCPSIRNLEPPRGNGHTPFFAVSTLGLNSFLLANSARFIAAIHHMASCVRPGPQVQNFVPVPMIRLNRVLADLLMYSLSSVDYAKVPWLFCDQWLALSPDRADDAPRMEQGLRIKHTIDERGMAFLTSFAISLMLPSSNPAADANVAWPCGYSELRTKPQAEPQARTLAAPVLRFLPPKPDNSMLKFTPPMRGSSTVRNDPSNVVAGTGTTGSAADLSQVGSRSTNSWDVTHVSDALASSQEAAQLPSMVLASHQDMPLAADNNNNKAKAMRQGRQDETKDRVSNIAAQHLETQTSNNPEEDSINVTTNQPGRRGDSNSGLDTAHESSLPKTLNPLLHSLLNRKLVRK